MNMTLLVTGGAGFIGSSFVRLALSRGAEIIVLDSLTYAGNPDNLAGVSSEYGPIGKYRFVMGDIANYELVSHVLSTHAPTVLVNFAAESHVDRSIVDPGGFIRTNVKGTQVLLDAARNHWSRTNSMGVGKIGSAFEWPGNVRFVQVSTDEVYGSLGSTGSFTETTPLDPRSPYSASKAAADHLVSAYSATYGMPVNITRCSNNYGPRQFPEKLIPLIINNCLERRPIPVYGDGLQVRDWIHVDDHCEAIWLVVTRSRPGSVYNVGANAEVDNLSMVRKLISLVREETGDDFISENLIAHVPDRLGHDRRYAIDSSLIRKDLGWMPSISLDAGLRETVKWYIGNRDWVSRVVSGEYRKFYSSYYGI